jgi:DNA repair ATPase RecN
MITQADKEILRHQLANIDWDSPEETEGRELALDILRISDAIKLQAERVERAGDTLQAGDADGQAESLLDDISGDLADALDRLDAVRARLF